MARVVPMMFTRLLSAMTLCVPGLVVCLVLDLWGGRSRVSVYQGTRFLVPFRSRRPIPTGVEFGLLNLSFGGVTYNFASVVFVGSTVFVMGVFAAVDLVVKVVEFRGVDGQHVFVLIVRADGGVASTVPAIRDNGMIL